MASPSLTPNAILALNSGDVDLRPMVQVLDIRQIGTAQSVQERYRLVLSDGNYVQQAMLATQLNEHVKSGQVQKGTIVQLLEYICNTVQQRKIIIVLNMEVVAATSEIIGDPKQVISTDQAAASAPGNMQQQQRSSLSANPAQPQQPQAYAGMSNGGYKTGPGSGAQPVNGPYSKGEVGVGGGSGSAAYNPHSSRAGQTSSYEGEGGGGAGLAGALKMPNAQASPYGRPMVAPPFQPPPMYSNRGPIVKNEAPARIIPIAALNPYQGRWTIKARVTFKSELRRFHNAKGDGKVFNFDLLDAEGGEIRAICFNTVAEQFYDLIEVGKVYLLSKGNLKAAQKSFNHLKNEWEIFLENSSTIEQCFDEDASIPQQQFDFRPIIEIGSTEENTMVDIIGIVVAINPSNTIMRKNGTETQKRSLQLRDMSGCSVELTMWGAFCTREGQHLQDLCDSGQFPVLAVKAGRVTDFSGKTVGTLTTTQLLVNPDLPEALKLKGWFEQEGKNTASQSISRESSSGTRAEMRKTVAQIKDEGLGRSEKPDWIAVKATISFIKTENFCYTACPLPVGDRQCSKKVTNNGDGTWRCDRCDRSVPECDYRYLLSMQVQDHTGVTWITAFQEAGEEIMGVTAKELYMWRQDENLRFGELVQKLLFSQYLFKLRVKEESYNDEQRVKCTVVKSERLDYLAECRVLLGLIEKLSRGEAINGPEFTTTSTGGTNASFFNTGYGDGSGAGNGQAGTHGGFGYGGGGKVHHGSTGFGGGYGGNGSSNSYSVSGFNGGASKGSSTNPCFKCGQSGHWPRDCPNQSGKEANFGGFGGIGGYGRGY